MPPQLLINAGHKHISEREPDGSWEDCTWDSGLEWYRICYDTSRPATHAEAQALRAASGEPTTGGSNIGDLRRGIAARYGQVIPASLTGFAALWSALKPGYAAVAQGSMSAFGPTHRLSTYDRNFDGAHAVLVARVYNEDRVWWCDPEAPLGSYQGVWVTKAELQKFVNAFSGSHVVQKVKVPAPAPVPSGDIMPALTAYLPGYTANIKPLSNIRALPASTATKLRVSGSVKEPVVLIGTVKGTVDPANGSDVWYVWWKNARYEYTAKDNILDVKAPAAAPTYPDLSKELADAQAQLAERSATVNEQSIIIAADKTIIADLRARLDRIVKRITDLTL